MLRAASCSTCSRYHPELLWTSNFTMTVTIDPSFQPSHFQLVKFPDMTNIYKYETSKFYHFIGQPISLTPLIGSPNSLRPSAEVIFALLSGTLPFAAKTESGTWLWFAAGHWGIINHHKSIIIVTCILVVSNMEYPNIYPNPSYLICCIVVYCGVCFLVHACLFGMIIPNDVG